MSTLFYRNRRLLILAIGIILVAGLASYEVLPRREDPELTPRNALVITRYPGADAERVEQLVTEKLENVIDEFEEVKKATSTSRRGISTISVELKDQIIDVDRVWSEMRDDLRAVRAELPAEAGDPLLDDLDIDASTIIYALTWTAAEEPQVGVMQRYAEELADQLRRVPGTKETTLFGANPEEITVAIDPERLAARGISPRAVADAIRASDSKIGAGRFLGADSELSVEVGGELTELARLRELPIRYGGDDSVVRLGELGKIEKGIADPPRRLAFADGRRAIAIAVLLESDQRIDDWGLAVDGVIADYEANMPGGFELDLLFDQRTYTADRLNGLLSNLGISALLVCLVVFLLMGWRSALVVSTALPLAALCVLAGMRGLGIPIHQMSVTGLIISLGLLIDTAIVMVDEVRHRLGEGSSALEAVQSSVKGLAIPLAGSTFTTVLSFMPIGLMPGPAGEFVGSIAISVTLAILSSFALALTLVPAMTAMLGRPRAGRFRILSVAENGLSWSPLTRAYRTLLGFLMKRPWLPILLALLLPLGGFVAAGGLVEQFFPAADRDQFPIELRLEPQASIEETRKITARARRLMLQHPEVEAVHWFIGQSAPKFYYNMLETENDVPWFAHALVQLKDEEGSFEVMRRIQRELDDALPAGQFLVRPLEQGPPFQAPVEIHVKGPDLDRLHDLGEVIRTELSTIAGVTHTRATLSPGLPQLHLVPNEERANLIGLSRRDLARSLEAQLDGAVGGSMLEGPTEIPVRVRIGDRARSSIERIASLELNLEDEKGSPVWTSMDALTKLRLEPIAGDIEHKDGQRSNTIQGYIEAGRLPATVLGPLIPKLEALELPLGYEIEVGGESEQRDRAVGNLMASVGILLALMVATLVLSFGSFRLAAVIGAVGFMAVGISLGALRLFEYPFGFMAIVGTMGLIGVAINDSIVVLAAIRDDARARLGDPEAVAEITLRSTRHVLATTATTAIGFAPLMIAGGGFWPPVAVTIGGGVIGATVLALLFIPSTYVLLHRRRGVAA